MRIPLKLLVCGLSVFLLAHLGGCGCGFDCNSNDDNSNPALLTLGLSDSLPEDLKQVVIEVDTITFRRSATSTIPVETFTIAGQAAVPTFKIDLLKYPGESQLKVITDLELPTGRYDAVEIKILDGGLEHSYVQLQDDSSREITVKDGILTLPGMELSSGSQQFVVEFGLAQSLQYQSTPEKYLLASDGIRVENTVTGATLSGQVDSALFDTVKPCSEKTDPLVGNRVYLYQRSSSLLDKLADVFTTASATTVPANVNAPFAVASLFYDDPTGHWRYAFGYLPAGDYTMAFACDTQVDDAVNFDNLVIPLPVDQTYKISLTASKKTVCDLAVGGSC